jgi:hypothetical protein
VNWYWCILNYFKLCSFLDGITLHVSFLCPTCRLPLVVKSHYIKTGRHGFNLGYLHWAFLLCLVVLILIIIRLLRRVLFYFWRLSMAFKQIENLVRLSVLIVGLWLLHYLDELLFRGIWVGSIAGLLLSWVTRPWPDVNAVRLTQYENWIFSQF